MVDALARGRVSKLSEHFGATGDGGVRVESILGRVQAGLHLRSGTASAKPSLARVSAGGPRVASLAGISARAQVGYPQRLGGSLALRRREAI